MSLVVTCPNSEWEPSLLVDPDQCLRVAVFLLAIGWTVRDNLTGAETGTGDANADRRPVDRAANAFVPVVAAYLAVGSYGLLAVHAGLPFPLDGYRPRASHLLAAGTAARALSPTTQHLREHGLDAVLVGLVIAAVYVARESPREVESG